MRLESAMLVEPEEENPLTKLKKRWGIET